ncbi:hypothetical protein RCL1_001008 [Eukaryota sp. TZLM3-RCL]
MFSFFKKAPPPVDPREEAKEWKKQLRTEKRGLERQVRQIEQQEMKTQMAIKQAAKENRLSAARILAKELVRSKKAKERLWSARAQLNSMEMQISANIGTAKLASAMSSSTQIMQTMGALLKLPELNQTMMRMAQEMERAGMIDEMVNETLDSALGDENEESEAEEELDSIVNQIITEQFSKVKGPASGLPQNSSKIDENIEEDDVINQRLAALRS